MKFEEREDIKVKLEKQWGLSRILGNSSAINKIREKIESLAACDVSVLITGESGTGKELAARAIHYLSRRCAYPFIPVNCGAIPENLFENELFGHRKGAFTDAAYSQVGLVAEAQEGSLFLDEIGVINALIQVKLLRLIQEKEYRPLGDPKCHKADIRIIAATNNKLLDLVSKGVFREDLYYRLSIVPLHIPPLRERTEDIPALADYFIKKYASEYDVPVKQLTVETLASMSAYPWPGNIRELENKIQHALIMAEDNFITSYDLNLSPVDSSFMETSKPFESFKDAKQKVIYEFEKNYLNQLMSEFKGDVVSAAEKAGKSRTALWNLLSKYRIHPRQFEPEKK